MLLSPYQNFEKIFRLLEQSFPKEERRDRKGQRALFSLPLYRIEAEIGEEYGSLLGFFALWQLPQFLFVEHFAVAEEMRGKGLGSQMLRELEEKTDLPICLEVEPPQTPLAKRRIAFYERAGFSLNPYPYTQPSLGKGRAPIPLFLMSYPAPLSEEEFFSVRDTLYETVYQIPKKER